MRILLVLAHPVRDSFSAAVANLAVRTLKERGHEVDFLDLYAEDFDPRLSSEERRGYFAQPYDASRVADLTARLRYAEGLILVFPQWWFNFPAVLKGFFDRVFAPGVAFTHDKAGGRIVRALTGIRLFWAFTSTGSPWWIVNLYMGNPVRRLLKRGIASFCAKQVQFRMKSLYDMDRATESRRKAHLRRLEKLLRSIR